MSFVDDTVKQGVYKRKKKNIFFSYDLKAQKFQ